MTCSPRGCLGLCCRALNPDASSCLWINNLLAQAWPHLERFGCRFLKSGDFLESQINATTFWRPPVLRSSYIKVQGVALGQVGEGGRGGAVAPASCAPVLLVVVTGPRAAAFQHNAGCSKLCACYSMARLLVARPWWQADS